MITRIFTLLTVLALLVSCSVVDEGVPTELFGITLGMTATKTQDSPAGEMPVKRLTGLIPWSNGARYYYEPEQESEAFPFLEYQQGDELSFPTNHSSLVLPVIPASVKTISEWEEHTKVYGEQFTIMTVEYTSQQYDSVHEAYLAASALCNDYSDDLTSDPSREADIANSETNEFVRTCIFTQDNRELEINQNGPKFVYRLLFNYEYLTEADKAVAVKTSEMRQNATTAMNE